MAAQFIWYRLRHSLAMFRSARSGNVAVIFALAVVPVIGAVGTAVDYSRANSARTAMQAVLDSTALMLAKEADSLGAGQLTQRAQSIFNAMHNRSETLSVQVAPAFNSATGQLTLSGTGALKTTFANVLGISHMDISTMSEVVVGGAKLEIALVLDNTGSMASSGKMQALVSASRMFVRELKKASKKPGDIKISVVPFDTRVNIGTAYNNETWIDWGGMSSSERKAWSGCVIDRDQPYDVNDAPPTGSSASHYPADKNPCVLARMLPLTSDFALAEARLVEMSPKGSTNVTIGLAWGLHALTASLPLTDGAPSTANVEKYIVFLTDGQNTQNRWTSNTSSIDARTKAVCDNIRAANIKVYSIRMKDGNEALLKHCATNPSMYYNVPAVSEIMAVFNDISRNVTKLRIAR